MPPFSHAIQSVESAITEGIHSIFWEGSEWWLDVQGDRQETSRLFGSPVCAIADDGYGDILFVDPNDLPPGSGNRVFLHRFGCEVIEELPPSLEILIILALHTQAKRKAV